MPKLYRPGERIDHYEIIQRFGSGAASRVYQARDTQMDQQVVLKFPVDDLVGDAEGYQRYLREKEIGKRLDHPHIQYHLNQSEQRQMDYLVLEYFEGRTLREVIRHEGIAPLPVARVLRLLVPVCMALAYAHERGVIHRDVKPENILVSDTGEVKIIDFGIALLETKRRLPWYGPQPLIGTPNYMAPELFWGKRGTVRCDIYGVGVILYELLAGQIPFSRKDEFTFMNPQMAHDPPSILTVKADLHPALATVVMHAIRRDPEKRYARMEELLHDLQHLDEVIPLPYVPDRPKVGGRYRQVISIGLIILAICLCMVAFGFLAQYAHPIVH